MSLQLQQEIGEHESLTDAAKEQLKQGAAPSEEALKDWTRLERRIAQLQAKQQQMLTQTMNGSGSASLKLMSSSVDQRPTAYIPDDLLGLPVPYGSHAPFKPATATTSSSLRHFRNPVIKPIEM
jgi:hypothetical protein